MQEMQPLLKAARDDTEAGRDTDGTLEGLAGDTRVALGEDVDSESHDSLGALVGDEVTDT